MAATYVSPNYHQTYQSYGTSGAPLGPWGQYYPTASSYTRPAAVEEPQQSSVVSAPVSYAVPLFQSPSPEAAPQPSPLRRLEEQVEAIDRLLTSGGHPHPYSPSTPAATPT
eukprot:RCo014247